MRTVATIIILLAIVVTGCVAGDVQCRVVRPSRATIVVACSAGNLEARR